MVCPILDEISHTCSCQMMIHLIHRPVLNNNVDAKSTNCCLKTNHISFLMMSLEWNPFADEEANRRIATTH
jgi:hypothetical protein